jgi:hypothetical protein
MATRNWASQRRALNLARGWGHVTLEKTRNLAGHRGKNGDGGRTAEAELGAR